LFLVRAHSRSLRVDVVDALFNSHFGSALGRGTDIPHWANQVTYPESSSDGMMEALVGSSLARARIGTTVEMEAIGASIGQNFTFQCRTGHVSATCGENMLWCAMRIKPVSDIWQNGFGQGRDTSLRTGIWQTTGFDPQYAMHGTT